KNDEARAFKILQFRSRHFTINLSHALFTTHCQERMTQSNEDGDRGYRRRDRTLKPSKRIIAEVQIALCWPWHRTMPHPRNGYERPHDQDDDHRCRDLHDAQRLLT